MRQRGKPTAVPRAGTRVGLAALLSVLLAPGLYGQTCTNTVRADVVALDQSFFYNRLGAHDPGAMIFALKRNVVSKDGSSTLSAGNVRLRDGVRPRPLVLRVNEGDCLEITFTNLLAPTRPDDNQPATRTASVHVAGMELVGSIASDGSFVGKNPSSLAAPGETKIYTLLAQKEGIYFMHTGAVTTGGGGFGGAISRGLFGAVNVEPKGAEWYRSQVTQADFESATVGTTPAGQPIIDYDAVHPAGHPRAGEPILKMLHNGEIIYGDLRAIITGPNKGHFAQSEFPAVAALRDRTEPFREFTIVFHDEIGIVQAFDNLYDDPEFEHVLNAGRDAFAINYGTGGIGSEILANRFEVGPMWDCSECKYEEFFLTSWVVGDPAMPVDVPADADLNGDGQPDAGPKATKILYPRDPANYYSSYMSDHVKIRNLHVGPGEHHIFHLHAHQWLQTPDGDNSTYLDSQAIGPGSAFTYDIAYDGSSNRNKTVGDAIFHCHFYPHFAMGMWALWRNHDVYETGTPLDADGRPLPGSRAYVDGEIATGIPIPAIVPLPQKALPPMPTADMPGYPFYIPGIAGHRPPHPPLDTDFDGGLPRHVVKDGTASFPQLNTLDFHKDNVTMVADSLPEEGTPLERNAMDFHAQSSHPSFIPDPNTFALTAGEFLTNGLPPVAGAPYADPCRPVDKFEGFVRTYKAAGIQIDAKYNKAGWHFPQHRMFALWEDVVPVELGQKAPEPMFLRTNSRECLEYRLVNLIPKEYDLDDFQVQTPTDVIGQHIHLVKFDVTSSDGSGNGWNYEDGSFSNEEVLERIRAIRKQNGCTGIEEGDARDGTFECPVPKAHPFFGPTGPNGEDWRGAQETVQRWFVDPLENTEGVDRTLRTIFTHDHFGPSTHQQAGLYAGVITEPKGSTWRNPETGEVFGGEGLLGARADGGPTSWRADIIFETEPERSYREFLLEFQDITLSYEAGAGVDADGNPVPDPNHAINPAGRDVTDPTCPNGNAPPCPELISSQAVGTLTSNYRNEPARFRITDPATGEQAAGEAGDLSHLFRSIQRADARFNVQPDFYPPLTADHRGTDPFTPLLRAYEGDRTQIRLLVGAHEEMHWFSMHGNRWLFEISDPNSGYRNSQGTGISEHFEMEFTLPAADATATRPFADYLWMTNATVTGFEAGMWGLLRAYDGAQGIRTDLKPLPNNSDGKLAAAAHQVCPAGTSTRSYDVTAVTAGQALPDGKLVYNSRGSTIYDPTGMLYVRTADLDASGKLKAGVPVEPLILRAAAGECIQVTLRNRLDTSTPTFTESGTPSAEVGLHPQLVSFDITDDNAANVGFNPVQTVDLGENRTFQWYAGIVRTNADGTVDHIPTEFGAVNLLPSDPIQQHDQGMIGALIIEPQGSSWTEDADSRASATVTKADGTSFRDFAVLVQDDIGRFELLVKDDQGLTVGTRVLDGKNRAINYRTDPQFHRLGYDPDLDKDQVNARTDIDLYVSNTAIGGVDPETPVFTAKAGTPVRIRFLHPGGVNKGQVMSVFGHAWQEMPYVNNSTEIGDNPLSEVKGTQPYHGPSNHFDVVLPSAGGANAIPGDYLIRTHTSEEFEAGMWAILRVTP